MEVDEEFVSEFESAERKIILPGDLVTSHNLMRGHGTFLNNNGELISSVAGRVVQINKLISVHAPRARFVGETGDVVVGRIIEVQVGQRRWKVETGARLDSVLILNHINLPGGELRRKTVEDEIMMRSYFKEGDLIVAEVQSTFQDGSLSLHTRSLRYGLVGQGALVRVPPNLVERCKVVFINLPQIGVHLILANNGYVWISPSRTDEEIEYGFDLSLEPLPLTTRQTIARMRNCIHIMKTGKIMLNSNSCTKCFEESMEFQVRDLLEEEVISKIIGKLNKKTKRLTA
uniref:Exosome complex component RRP4 n=1 Tax=Aceria tosichella TaxID=561515 RepID=A0A6G1SAP3_9ACAR